MKKFFSFVLLVVLGLGFYSCEKPLTEAQIQAMIDKSIPEQEKGLSDKDVQDLIDNAIADYAKFQGHAYVDLGLPSGILWATCNVGAENPWECGDYFAWGETTVKTDYSWNFYKYGVYNSSASPDYGMTKYNTPDKKETLDLADDAAHAIWGGSWRMPTKEELQELNNNCIWTWTTKNGINGYEVKSKTNGNSIFLPAAGIRYNSVLDYAGSYGYYWSSSLNSFNQSSAYCLYFGSGGRAWDNGSRFYGLSVRAVCSK